MAPFPGLWKDSDALRGLAERERGGLSADSLGCNQPSASLVFRNHTSMQDSSSSVNTYICFDSQN